MHPSHLARSVLVLGAGRSSIVLSLNLAEWADVLEPVDGVSQLTPDLDDGQLNHVRIALRLSKQGSKAPMEDLHVRTALQPYVGFARWVALTDAFRERFGALPEPPLGAEAAIGWGALGQLVVNASVAMMMPDFSWVANPLRVPLLRAPDHAVTDATVVAQRTTIEIKPKGAWRPPRFVAARYTRPDGIVVERTVHSAKLHRCRFSMMQQWKQQRRGASQQATGAVPACATYCPNDLLQPTKASLALAMADLMHTPENNLKVVSVQLDPKPAQGPMQLQTVDAKLIGLALERLDVCQRLVDLQLADAIVDVATGAPPRQTGDASVPVVDVELLFLWREFLGTEGASGFQLCDVAAAVEQACGCRQRSKSTATAPPPSPLFHWRAVPHRWAAPQFSFDDALERFYVATTAKDVSFLFTIERHCGDGDALETLLDDGVVRVVDDIGRDQRTSLSFVVADHASAALARRVVARCRTAVVDIDSKRHKSLEHYYEQDQAICTAASYGA